MMTHLFTFLAGAAIAAAGLVGADTIFAAQHVGADGAPPRLEPSSQIKGLPPIDSRVRIRPDVTAAYCDLRFKKKGGHTHKYVCVFAFRPQCRVGNGKWTIAARSPSLVRTGAKYWTVQYTCNTAPK